MVSPHLLVSSEVDVLANALLLLHDEPVRECIATDAHGLGFGDLESEVRDTRFAVGVVQRQ